MQPPLVVRGFVAGVLAALLFHQGVVFLRHLAGLAPPAWDLRPTPPLAVPPVALVALSGGLWGLVLAPLAQRLREGRHYGTACALFGAAVPTLAALLVEPPLAGPPPGAAVWLGVVAGVVANAAWGLGTGLLLLFL